MLILVAAGALTSVWLELVHYRAYSAPGDGSLCAIGATIDCGSVALSKYAVLFGVPLPAWGFCFFLWLALLVWQGSRWILPLTALASVAGLVLTAISALEIGAWCIGCELVHALDLALLGLAWRARAELAPAPEPRAARRAASLSALFSGLPALGVLLAVRLLLPAYWSVFTWQSALPFAHGRTEEGDPWIGAATPALTLEEFVDYTCPHCKAASARSLMQLAAHPAELRLVRRHHPRMPCLPQSETRCLGLRVALCADAQDRFWQADRWLFEHAQGGAIRELESAARDLGLDPVRFAACVRDDATFARANAEWKRVRKARLPGTPYYATGERLVTAPEASALIDAL